MMKRDEEWFKISIVWDLRNVLKIWRSVGCRYNSVSAVWRYRLWVSHEQVRYLKQNRVK